ncbi:MAG: DUF1697 domain-containing protein [Nitrospirota bacterium]
MTTFVALLRGINVSGQKRIRMADLQKSCEALGFNDVRSYLQSGNVVFRANQSAPRKLAAALRAQIAKDFGHEVEVLVLSAKDLSRVAKSSPLRPRSGSDETLFHATFLFEPVSANRFQNFTLPAQSGEQAALVGQVVFLHCPHGYGRTKLNNAYFEKAFGVPATTRNWRTVLALQELCGKL